MSAKLGANADSGVRSKERQLPQYLRSKKEDL